jgi:hypothetical protein
MSNTILNIEKPTGKKNCHISLFDDPQLSGRTLEQNIFDDPQLSGRTLEQNQHVQLAKMHTVT